jgi:hypothetical protein
MKTLRWAILLLVLVPTLCLAQAAKKIPVSVSHDNDDQVGRSFAFALKEAIRGSQSFKLVDDEVTTPRIVVHLVSVGSSEQQLSSAIAIVFVYDSLKMPAAGAYISSSVLCGRDRVEYCAKSTLPPIDHAVELLRKDWPDLWKTL